MRCDELIRSLMEVWEETRGLTYDFVKNIPLEVLNKKLPRIGLDSFAKQIYEMALVQKAYTRVLNEKFLDFSNVEEITTGKKEYIAESKQELLDLLIDADRFLIDSVGKVKDWNEEIEVFGENIPIYLILEYIIRHETLHQGQFVAFGYLLKIKFPQSWIEAWALPT